MISSLPGPASSLTLPPPAPARPDALPPAPVLPSVQEPVPLPVQVPTEPQVDATAGGTLSVRRQENGEVASQVDAAVGMKLICQQAELAAGLACVNRAVLPHSTKPILKNILLSTDQGRLRLQGTDLAFGIQVWIDAQIETEGITALPADLFTRMISLMPSGPLTLTIAPGSQTLDIQAVGSATSIRGQDPREFPHIPSIEPGSMQQFSVIDARLLKKMIEDVAFAAATDDIRPVLTAVFFHITEGKLLMAAANTHRMVEFVAPLSTASDAAPVLIPAHNLQELARILPTQGKIQIMITPRRNLVIFQREDGDHLNFVTCLIEGEYPQYQRAIPREFTTTAVIETKALSTAIARAALFAHDEIKTVRVTLKEGVSGSLLIESEDADMGHHVSSVAAQVTGPECQILFPVRYMREALEHLDGPQTRFLVLTTGKPAVFRPTSEMQYTSMVMSAKEKTPAPEGKGGAEKKAATEKKPKK